MTTNSTKSVLLVPEGIVSAVAAKSRERRTSLQAMMVTEGRRPSDRNDLAPPLAFEYRKATALMKATRRLRKASAVQQMDLKNSVGQFGICGVALITPDSEIIDGHLLVDTCLAMGIVDVPCDEVEILHAEQRQLHYVGVLTWIHKLDELWKSDLFVIETIGAGKGLPHALEEYGIKHVAEIGTHRGVSKQARMEIASLKIEQGKIWLPSEAPWLDDFLTHIAEFPHGPGEDWADALSQLIIYLDEISSWARFHKAQRTPPLEPPRQTGLRYGRYYRCFEFT